MTEREGVLYKQVQTVWDEEYDDNETWVEMWVKVASRLPTETLHELLDPSGEYAEVRDDIAPIINAELDRRLRNRWWR